MTEELKDDAPTIRQCDGDGYVMMMDGKLYARTTLKEMELVIKNRHRKRPAWKGRLLSVMPWFQL